MKRVLSFILSALMIVSCFVITVSADDAAAAAEVDALIDAIGDINADSLETYSGLRLINPYDTGDERGWFEWYARDAGRTGPFDIDLSFVVEKFDVQRDSAVGFSFDRDFGIWYSFANKRFELLQGVGFAYDPDAKVVAASDTIELVPGVKYTLNVVAESTSETNNYMKVSLDDTVVLDCPNMVEAMRNNSAVFTEDDINDLSIDKLLGSYVASEYAYTAVTFVDFVCNYNGELIAEGDFFEFEDSYYDGGYWGNPNEVKHKGFDWMVVGAEGASDGYWHKHTNFLDPVAKAEAAYNALTDAQKGLVTGAADLAAARLAFDTILAADVIATYDAILAGIGVVGTSDSIDAIEAAAALYDGLTESQKALVTSYEAVVGKYDGLRALEYDEAVDKAVDSIGVATAMNSALLLRNADILYGALSDAQKALVAKLETYNTTVTEKLPMLVNADKAVRGIEGIDVLLTALENETAVGGDVLHFYREASADADKNTRFDTDDGSLFDDEAGELGYLRESFDIYINDYWCDDNAYSLDAVPVGSRSSYFGVSCHGVRGVLGYDMGTQRFFYNKNCHETPYGSDAYYQLDIDVKDSTAFAFSKVTPITTGAWYHVEFLLMGKTARVWLNGELVFEYQHSDIVKTNSETMKVFNQMDCYIDNMAYYRLDAGVWDYDYLKTEDGQYTNFYEIGGYYNMKNIPETTIGAAAEARLADIVDSYSKLTAEEQALVGNVADLNEYLASSGSDVQFTDPAVVAVIDAIDALGHITTVDQEADVVAVRAAYKRLSDNQKAAVSNYDVLVAAETAIDDIKVANKVVEIIKTVAGLTVADFEADPLLVYSVDAARGAYDALTEAQQAFVHNIDVLVKAEIAREEYENPKFEVGDYNGDGTLNVLDAILIVKEIVGDEDVAPVEGVDLDVDGNGEVNILDAIAIAKNIVA